MLGRFTVVGQSTDSVQIGGLSFPIMTVPDVLQAAQLYALQQLALEHPASCSGGEQ
jgi:hypothetical protein